MRQPAGEAGHGEDAEARAPAGPAPAPCRGRGRSPPSARGLPSGLVRGTTSVLMASATTSCMTTPVTVSSDGDDVELCRACSSVIQPPAAPASSTKLDRDQAGADEHVGAALRAEQRHGVDQLAEHHLHGPRQAEPDRQRGSSAGVQVRAFLTQKVSATAVRPDGAVGEIDHQQRQIREPHGADRRQQRVLDLLPPVVGGVSRSAASMAGSGWSGRRDMATDRRRKSAAFERASTVP